MKRTVRLDEKTYEIEFRHADGTIFFRNGDGRDLAASISEVEPGLFHILIENRSFEARFWPGSIGTRSTTATFEIIDPREWRGPESQGGLEGRHSIASLMPGRVVRVLVSEGDSVEAGQGLLVVEAMKMQNELKTPKSGIVRSLNAREGGAVAAGETLAVVE